jgi:hypothetical protein
MSFFDLRSYLTLFPVICRSKFGQAFDFDILERRLVPVRDGIRSIESTDVLDIFHPKQTPFSRYWKVPKQEELEQSLKQKPIFLEPDSPNTRVLLVQLLDVFANLFVASIIMRFVCPEHYGVSSTPVINLLQVQRSTTIEGYIAFIEELKAWQEHYEMPSIAQTEMALWAYDQTAKGMHSLSDKARQDFEGDIWCQRRRIGQVVRPFLRNYGKLQLARILAGEDPKLAGKIAGEEYERLLRLASQKYFKHPLKDKKGEAEKLIADLARYTHITPEDKYELDKIWETRYSAVHPDGKPEEHEVENMIDRIERICSYWGKMSSKKTTKSE